MLHLFSKISTFRQKTKLNFHILKKNFLLFVVVVVVTIRTIVDYNRTIVGLFGLLTIWNIVFPNTKKNTFLEVFCFYWFEIMVLSIKIKLCRFFSAKYGCCSFTTPNSVFHSLFYQLSTNTSKNFERIEKT